MAFQQQNGVGLLPWPPQKHTQAFPPNGFQKAHGQAYAQGAPQKPPGQMYPLGAPQKPHGQAFTPAPHHKPHGHAYAPAAHPKPHGQAYTPGARPKPQGQAYAPAALQKRHGQAFHPGALQKQRGVATAPKGPTALTVLTQLGAAIPQNSTFNFHFDPRTNGLVRVEVNPAQQPIQNAKQVFKWERDKRMNMNRRWNPNMRCWIYQDGSCFYPA